MNPSKPLTHMLNLGHACSEIEENMEMYQHCCQLKHRW
jgi:hypothetical protein